MDDTDLTDPERRLREELIAGRPCRFAPVPPGTADSTRVVRGEALRALLLDPALRNTGSGIEIEGATISGPVRLPAAGLPDSIVLRRCTFVMRHDRDGDAPALDLADARLGTLRLETCSIFRPGDPPGATPLRCVNLERASLSGSVLICACDLDGDLRAIGAMVKGDFNLHGTRLLAGGTLDADSLRVDGRMFLRSGFSCDAGVRLQSARIGIDVDARNARFRSQRENVPALLLLGARIGGALELTNTRVEGPGRLAINADNATIGTWVALNGRFRAFGSVSLRNTSIGGNLNCDGGRFRAVPAATQRWAINAEYAAIGGCAFFRRRMLSAGAVRLLGASIGGALELGFAAIAARGGVAIDAERVRVAGDLILRADRPTGPRPMLVGGAVNLMGAEIGGSMLIEHADFRTAPAAHHLFNRMTVAGTFALFRTRFGPARAHERPGQLRLIDVSVRTLHDDPASWPPPGCLVLDGFTYDRLAPYRPAGVRPPRNRSVWKQRLAWLKRQPPEHLGADFRPQPFDQLAGVLRAMGHDRDARKISIQRRIFARRSASWPGWIGSWLLGMTCQHGYRPFRALWWMAGIVLLGAVLYHQARGAVVTTREHPPASQERFDPLWYSLDVFLPVVSLQQKEAWAIRPDRIPPDAPPARRPWVWIAKIFRPVETLLGWGLGALFIAGVGGLIRRE